MDLQKIINSPRAGELALRICEILPPALGKGFARWVADRISPQKDMPLVRAMRLNRYVVSGCRFSSAELDRAVRASLRNLGVSYYNLFHNINYPKRLEKLVEFSPELDRIIQDSKTNVRGLVVLGVHLNNFDLILQAAAWRGLKAAALTLPEETENKEGVDWQNRFRSASGLEMLPASFSSFRQAITRLQAGGTILTGVDHPIPTPKYRPLFFNYPANLPVHYVTLALAARVPLVLLSAHQKPDGRYYVQASNEIWLTPDPDREKEMLANAEKVLEIAADRIRQAPDQWNIFQPVWDGFEAELP